MLVYRDHKRYDDACPFQISGSIAKYSADHPAVQSQIGFFLS